MDSVSPTSSGSSATQNTGATSRNDATDHTATSATTAAVTGTTTVSQLAAAAQTGSPVDQGKALRALDGITKDPQATNALVAQGAEGSSVQAGLCYSGTAIGRAPEAAASVGVSAAACVSANIPTTLSGLGDAGVVISGQVAGGIGQGTFLGAGPAVQVTSANTTEKTVFARDCTGFAEVDRNDTQVSATFDKNGISSVSVAQGIKVPDVPSIPSVGTGGFVGKACTATVTVTPNAVANSAAAAKEVVQEQAKAGVLTFTRGWVAEFMPAGTPSF